MEASGLQAPPDRVRKRAILMLSAGADLALSDPSEAEVSPSAAPLPACGSNEPIVYHSNLSPGNELGCGATQRTAAEVAEARAYLIETASPGYTMTLQGPELAIGRLHPEFIVRLEHAIREARHAGLPFAGVFSAYRPPAFGVGGFSDKFNSLHTYGLAVDMRGIGRPGSPEAQLWHQIAAKNGVVCPYGPRARTEWNHCQPTSVKMILAKNPLRDTVSAAGPFDLETMFEVGNPMTSFMAGGCSRCVEGPNCKLAPLDSKFVVLPDRRGRYQPFAYACEFPFLFCECIKRKMQSTPWGSLHQSLARDVLAAAMPPT